jgi:hypothetical protein
MTACYTGFARRIATGWRHVHAKAATDDEIEKDR